MLSTLASYHVDLAATPLRIGPLLEVERTTGMCSGVQAVPANAILKRIPRSGWEV
jgi:hypothetical protein